MAPQQRRLARGKEDSSHARFGRITSSNDDRMFWHYLGKAGWVVPEAGDEGFEVVNVAAEMLADLDLVLISMLEAMLKYGEEPLGTWNGKRHKSEFTKDFFPLLLADTAFPMEVVNEGSQSLLAVISLWQL